METRHIDQHLQRSRTFALAFLLSAATSAAAAPPSPDFDNDGFSDLVVGVPGDRDFGRVGCCLAYQNGAVNIIRGSIGGLSAAGNQLWGQDSPGILGTGKEVTDDFGSAMAAGDFNGDGRTDLAVGSPNDSGDGGGTDSGFHIAEGVVNVIYGSATGLNAAGNQLLNQKTAGIFRGGQFQDGHDQFGANLTSGDFNHDGFDDLAVGVPREDLDANWPDAHGLVYVIYGSLSGLRTTTSQRWTQDSPGIADVAEHGDHFGQALAAGDFDKDGYDDLAIGVPDEGLGNAGGPKGGAVHVLYGSKNRLTAKRSQFWTQDSSGVADKAESYDQFGFALAVGDFNKDGRDDLAIGAPRENLANAASTSDAGAVHVLYGTSRGLKATGSQFWSQNTAGVADSAERGERFGHALVAGDFDGDGADDLAIGVPGEDFGANTHYLGRGAVHVLFGSPARLTAVRSQFWTQDSPGVADTAEDGDSFGLALGKGDYNGDGYDDLVIGVPGETTTQTGDGLLHVLYGSNGGPATTGSQIWTQDSPNILGTSLYGEHFGAALTP